MTCLTLTGALTSEQGWHDDSIPQKLRIMRYAHVTIHCARARDRSCYITSLEHSTLRRIDDVPTEIPCGRAAHVTVGLISLRAVGEETLLLDYLSCGQLIKFVIFSMPCVTFFTGAATVSALFMIFCSCPSINAAS